MFRSRYMPCEQCGESVDRAAPDRHECSPERLAEFRLFALRDHVADLEDGFRSYLETAHGRFEAWDAARRVREDRHGRGPHV